MLNKILLLIFIIKLFPIIYSQNFSTFYGVDNEIILVVDSDFHNDYGISYPITYELKIPQNSSSLNVYRKYIDSDKWELLTEKTKDDIFNGVEAVRFDYLKSKAYVSVPFSSITDSIFLYITDTENNYVRSEYNKICKYYDNRDAVVCATADDLDKYKLSYFQTAFREFRKRNLWLSSGVIADRCDVDTWRYIQIELDSGFVEIDSHSSSHVRAPYPNTEYEVVGSKEKILNNLELPALYKLLDNEYIYSYIYPYGSFDNTIDKIAGENGYIVCRTVWKYNYDFTSFNYSLNVFNRVGAVLEMGVKEWTNITILNNEFTGTIAKNGIYHMILHPYTVPWEESYVTEHLDFISNHNNLWYVGFGHLALYNLLKINESEHLDLPEEIFVILESPKDVNFNYGVILDTSPSIESTPVVTTCRGLKANLIFTDGPHIPQNSTYPNHEYYFDRTWSVSVCFSEVIKEDTKVQRITVSDMENPKGIVPKDITLTNEQVTYNCGLSTSLTGEMTQVSDNSQLQVVASVNYELLSEDSEKKVYNAFHTLEDKFGNDTTYSPQKVTIMNAKISIETINDIVLNAQKELDLSPQGLTQLGYKSEPNVTKGNTTSDYTLTYSDTDTIYYSTSYPWADREFTRRFIAQLNSGSDADTMKCKIIVKDLESPTVKNLGSITITKDQSLHPSVTGYPEITDNVAVQDTVITYELISENTTEKHYKSIATVTDVFGNDTTFHYQDVKVDLATGIEEGETLPTEYKLSQNYPNPFNPTTEISYSIISSNHVTMKVYDLLGHEVIELVNKVQAIGNYTISIDASKLTSGIYFYRLQTGEFVATRKMILLK